MQATRRSHRLSWRWASRRLVQEGTSVLAYRAKSEGRGWLRECTAYPSRGKAEKQRQPLACTSTLHQAQHSL